MLQQYLPLAVLKLFHHTRYHFLLVALVATVLTACGIETTNSPVGLPTIQVATVLTACGIETFDTDEEAMQTYTMLQQYLPLAVLKLLLMHDELCQS